MRNVIRIIVMSNVTAALLASGWRAGAASLLINAGESYTQQFDTLPFVATGTGTPMPRANFEWLGRVLPGMSEVRVEMFENSAADVPLYSGTVVRSVAGLEPIGATWIVPNAWQDLQGIVRISVVSGSFSVSDLDLASSLQVDPTHESLYRQHFSYEIVPEPSSAILLVPIGLSVVVWRSYGRWQMVHKNRGGRREQGHM